MALLEKLYICGVRSFGPNEAEKMKFSTPLTLILGQNGCGKTTIIECLKFALTDVVPAGTGTGAGFVNDPKLSNKRSTKSSVKVRFKDCKGDHITVGKFAEVLMQSDKSLRFKRMAPSIRWEAGNNLGKPEDISGRCADVDAYCSQKLNVSKAILNNVIFCHQENSAWPLDEGKKLKEKFDEIFGSAEYNKCVERLRKFISSKKDNLKVLKAQLDHRKTIRDNAEKLKEAIQFKEEQLEQIQKTIEKKRNELQPLESRINEICKLESEINVLCQKLAGLEKTFEAIAQREKDIKKYIKEEFEGSDEDLENAIRNFNQNREKTKELVKELENKKKTLDCHLGKVNQELQKLQVNYGKIKAEEDSYKKILEELNELIEKTRAKLNVSVENVEPHMETVAKLKRALNAEEVNLKKLSKEKETTETQMQQGIREISNKLSAARNGLESKKDAINKHQKKIHEYKQKINSFAHSGKLLKEADKKINQLEQDLTKIKSEFDEFEVQNEIDTLDRQITEKDQLVNKLDREYKILQQNFTTEQNIEKERNGLAEKNAEIEGIRQKHEEDFNVLFGENIPENNFQQSVRRIQALQEKKLKALDRDISKSERQVSALSTEVKHTRDRLENCKEELKTKLYKIDKYCKGKRFSEVLNQSHSRKEKLQKDKGTYQSAKLFFDEFIVEFQQESPCCPVCETDFSEKESLVPNIIKRLKNKIEQLPTKLASVESELKKEENVFNQLQQLKPVNDDVSQLQDEKIPALELQLQYQEENLNEKNIELVALKHDRKDPDKLLEMSRKVISDVVVLDRLISEVNNAEKSLLILEKRLVQVPSRRNLNQTELELGKVKTDLANFRRQYKDKRDLCDESKECVQRTEKQLQAQKESKMNIEQSMNDQSWMEKEIKDYSEKISELEIDVRDLEDNIQVLEVELAQAEDHKADIVNEHKKELEKAREKLEEHKRLLSDISKLLDKVQKYEKSNSTSRLQETLEKLKENESNAETLQDLKKKLEENIVKQKQEDASQESKLRLLEDNQELRENQKKGEGLNREIAVMKKKIGNQNNKSIMEEKRKINCKIDSIVKEISSKSGEHVAIKKDIDDKEKELNKKENREAFTQYRKKCYEVIMEELTVSDLEKYTFVLENSILKFHQQKMEHINMTIRDLWRNIYKGNDIDYIEIQTDGKVGSRGGKRRNYDYKVVQVKKGVELEMRGRCSAGQKVLSCLVIRMALAETFSSNCGILALDEPTTNLDRENIDSLCDALSNIISTRQNRSSFQLLVITHDEEFLRTLTRSQSVSHYYKVFRNTEGFSKIQKEIL